MPKITTMPAIDYVKVRLFRQRRITEKDCWEWTGSVFDNGYGRTKFWGKNRRVHRISMVIFKDFSITSEFMVLHKCNNKICFNPDHLYIGTHQNNMDDGKRDGVFRGNLVEKPTHCSNGHEYNEENSYFYEYKRVCKLCMQLREFMKKEESCLTQKI